MRSESVNTKLLVLRYLKPALFVGVFFVVALIFFGLKLNVAKAAITYVGGAEASGNSANYNVSLTGLTGGSDSAAAAGDLVIVSTGFVGTANGNPGVSTAGYTEVSDLWQTDTRHANFSVNWKIMGGSPDTSVTCLGSTVSTNGAVCVVHVWRGVDSTPMDVTETEATAANASNPNSPSITPVTAGAIVISTGLGTHAAVDNAVTAPTGYGNQVDISIDPGSAATVGISSKAWSGSGAEDPAAWTNFTTSTSDSWAAVTLALRPAPVTFTVSGTAYQTNGSTNLGANKTVHLRVNGTLAGTGDAGTGIDETDASGNFSFSAVSASSGATITLYLDGETETANTITITDGSTNATTVPLYDDHVVIRSDLNSTAITILDLVDYDNDNDATDMLFTATDATPDTLVVEDGVKLMIHTGDTFTPGGTVTTSPSADGTDSVVDGDLEIDGTGTLSMGTNALSVGGDYNNEGTFSQSSGQVTTFTATATGHTLAGTLNGSSDFTKIKFNGTSGGWTITSAMLVSEANATDTFVINAGTVTMGDGNGDNLDVRGKMVIAGTAGETGTFETAAVTEGSTITVDVNANTSTPSCANCIIQVGATSGAGQGNFKLRKNTILRLNPRSAATASDTGIEVESTGYLEIQGTQETTNTVSSITESSSSTTITVSGTPWSVDQFNGNVVRVTTSSSLAFGRVYNVTDTTASTLVFDHVTSAQDTAPDVVGGTACSGSSVCTINVADGMLTASMQHDGRYLHNITDGKYYRISSSTEAATDTIGIINNSPDDYTTMGDNDDIEVTDGIRATDAFEILDYAHVTNENGTSCAAGQYNAAGEGYILSKSGSETVIRYGSICGLGRGAADRFGIQFTGIDGSISNQGLTIEKSEFKFNLRGPLIVGDSNNNNGTKGVKHNTFRGSADAGLILNGAANNLIEGNYSYENGNVGIYLESAADDNQFLYNRVYDNNGFGIYAPLASNNSDRNTFDANYVYNNGFAGNVPGFYIGGGSNNIIKNNSVHSHLSSEGLGIVIVNSPNSVLASNITYQNARSGFVLSNIAGGTAYNNISFNNSFHGMTNICNGGGGTDVKHVFFGNQYYSNTINGMMTEFDSDCTITAINEQIGVLGANGNADHYFGLAGAAVMGDFKVYSYNSTFASPTEFNRDALGGGEIQFLISKKHDGVAGATALWKKYSTPAQNTETPQDEATDSFNYVDNLWEKSVSPHAYSGTGTEDTDLNYNVSTADLSGGPYYYRVVAKTAGNCSTPAVFDVYRNLVDVGDVNCGSEFTDPTTSVKFTVNGGVAVAYVVGDAYSFTTWDASGDTNTQKSLTMKTDADTFTVPTGTTLEIKGQADGVNETTVTRGSTGGYQIIVQSGGTIDATNSSFNYGGGTGQNSAIDLETGATVLDLSGISFDNFAVNNAGNDAYIEVSSSIISSGTPSDTFTGITFVNTTGFANCNFNAIGTATGYWEIINASGAFSGESFDCDDGAADGDPGQFKWTIQASGITISGTAYQTNGVTNLGLNKTVHLRVDGTLAGTGDSGTGIDETDASGNFSFSTVSVSAGATLTLYLDDETEKANTITITNGSTDATSVPLYDDHVIIRSDNGATAITILDLVDYDNDNDATDMLFTATDATPDTLVVEDGVKLFIHTGDTFTPGGTVTTSPSADGTDSVVDGDLEIDGTGTLSMGTNALSVGGDYNNEGTFSQSSGQVTTFTATATGHTLAGTLNGSSDFTKIKFNGTGGGWTITSAMLVSEADATDTFVINAGTVTLGDGNGDNLDVRGKMVIAGTAGETGTFETAAVTEGSTITVDINANTSTPSCANCIIQVGATSGAGQGNFKLRKNTILRLNPRSAATASDTGIEVESTGYLEIQGTQETTNTVSSITESSSSTTITVSGTPWSVDQFNGMVIRMTATSSLAFGRLYNVIDTTANTIVIDAVTSSQDTAPDVQGGTACSGSSTCTISVADSVLTANYEHDGRYLHNITDDKYYRISESLEDTTDTIGIVTDSPDVYTTMGDGDDIEVTDGIRAGDAFEILDYAHVTAENGTGCAASANEAGEAYIQAKSGSETVIRYAQICNLGRAVTDRFGLMFQGVDGSVANQGVTIEKSQLKKNLFGVVFAANTSNNNGTKGIIDSRIDNNFSRGVYTTTASSNLIKGNQIDNNGDLGLMFETANSHNQVQNNRIFDNASYGIYGAGAYNNTFEGNYVYNNGYSAVQINMLINGGANNIIKSNLLHSNYSLESQGLAVIGGHNVEIASNSFYNNRRSGMVIQDTYGSTVFNNKSYDNFYNGLSNICANTVTNMGGIFFGNNFFDNERGHSFESDTACTSTIINESYGVLVANRDSDVFMGTAGAPNMGDFKIISYNSNFGSVDEFDREAATTEIQYFISRKHDGVAGATAIWKKYSTPAQNTETPQNEALDKFNYADNLWEKSVSPHSYFGTGTEDTDLNYNVSTADLSGGPYYYRVIAKTAGNCSTPAVFDVYRNQVDVGDVNCGSEFTDATTGVKFTINGGVAVAYVVADTYTFTAWDASGDTNTQKSLTMKTDADSFTVPSGTTLEIKGQADGVNETTVTRGSTGGYQIIVQSGGTIDATNSSFNYGGGTGQNSAIDLETGAVVTDLSGISFDNFAVNNAGNNAYIEVSSSIISSGTPSDSFTGITFDNTTTFADCNFNAIGTATGYWEIFDATGAFDGESFDCDDGAADGDPGQFKWSVGGIVISGTIYSDDGSTVYNCSSSGNLTVRVARNGALSQNVTCSAAGGTYTLPAIASASAGDVLHVFIDDATSTKRGSAVTRAADSSSAITINIYQQRVIIRSEDATALTNSNTTGGIGQYDADNNANIIYTANTNNLNLTAGKLIVWTGDGYTPGGTVTTPASNDGTDSVITGDVDIQASATLTMGTNALSVGGDFNNAGTFSYGSGQTTTFTATATGHTIADGTSNFHHVTFNGSGGGWSFTSAVTAAGALTMTAGTLSGTSDLTITTDAVGTAGIITLTGGTFEQRVAASEDFGPTTSNTDWTFNNLTFSRSAGTPIITKQSCSTCDVTVTGTMLVSKTSDGAGTTLSAGDATWTLSNSNSSAPLDKDQASGGIFAGTSTFVYSGDNDAGNVTLENILYHGLTLGGATAETYTPSATLVIGGNLTMDANATLSGTQNVDVTGTATGNGTINMSGGTFSVSGTSFGGTTAWTFNNLNFGSTDVTTGAVGYWKFDEGSGTTVADSSGSGNGANTGGNPPWATGRIDDAINLDGSTDWVDAGSNASLDNLTTFTAAFWIKPDTSIEGKRFLDKWDSNPGWAIEGTSNQRITVFISHSTANIERTTSNNSIAIGAWNHVMVTWDGTTNFSGVKVYINGVEATYSAEFNGSGTLQSDTAAPLIMGCDYSSSCLGGSYFDGIMDEMRLYSRVLSTTELAQVYGHTGVTGTTTASGTSNITVADTLTISASQTLNAGSKTWTLSKAGTSTSRPFKNSGTFSSGSTSTFIYSGNGDTDIENVAYNNLTFSPTIASTGKTYTLASGAWNIGGNLDINPTAGSALNLAVALGDTTTIAGTLTIQRTSSATSSLTTTASQHALSAGAINIAAGGTLTANNSTITLTGSGSPFTVTGTFTAGGSTVHYRGTSASNVAATSYNHLTLNPSSGSPTYTIASGTLAANDFVLGTNAVTVDANTNNPSLNISGNFTINANATFTKGSGTITFNKAAAQVITDNTASLQDLGAVATSNASTSVSTATNVKLTSLNIAGSTTWDISGDTMTITGNGTPLTVSGTFTTTGSTVVYSNTTSATLTGTTFNNLTLGVSGTPTYTLPASDITLRGNLVVTTGAAVTKSAAHKLIFAIGGGSSQTVTGNATNSDLGIVQVSANSGVSTLNMGSSVKFTSLTIDSSQIFTTGAFTLTLTGSTPLTNTGTFTASTGSTVDYVPSQASGSVTLPGSVTYYNVQFNKASNNFIPAAGTMQVNGNMDVTAGTLDLNTNDPTVTVDGTTTIASTLSASSASPLTIRGTFNNNGTFTHNNGSVIAAPLAAAQAIQGTNGTDFYNFTMSTPGKTLNFKEGLIFGFYNNLTLTGSSAYPIEIDSTTSSTWSIYIDPAATNSFMHMFVRRSACAPGTKNPTLNDSVRNRGNNGACWVFVHFGGGGGADGSGGGTPVGGGSGGGSSGESGSGGGGGTLPQAFTGNGITLTEYDSNWSINAGTFNITTNTVHTSSAGDSMARWTAGTFNDNQYAEITISVSGTGYIGAGVRLQSGAHSGYGVYCNGTDLKLIEWNAGTPTTHHTGSACANSDVLRLEISGTSLTVKKNGSTVTTVTDATFSTGRPGLVGNGNAQSTRGDNFYADSIASQGGGGGGGSP